MKQKFQDCISVGDKLRCNGSTQVTYIRKKVFADGPFGLKDTFHYILLSSSVLQSQPSCILSYYCFVLLLDSNVIVFYNSLLDCLVLFYKLWSDLKGLLVIHSGKGEL